jgi:hypothetical protein
MSLYDLRYTKAPSEKEKKSKITTKAYRIFPWVNTSSRFSPDFDYNAELGIIATVSKTSKYYPQTLNGASLKYTILVQLPHSL